MTKSISVGKNHFALVDDQDYEDLIQFRWKPMISKKSNVVYALRTWAVKKIEKFEYMHTRITGYKITDHINGDGLDNRSSNLREATHSQNHANRGKNKGSYSSVYKGVSWNSKRKVWIAQITQDRKNHYLGSFSSEEDAAKTYDAEALKRFGEFALLNFSKENYE